jgi:hypothetical protein
MQVMEGGGIVRGDAASGCEKFVLAGERVAAPQGALALQALHLARARQDAGPDAGESRRLPPPPHSEHWSTHRPVVKTTVVALATPAWAANDEIPRNRYTVDNSGAYANTGPVKAFEVCKGSGTPLSICAMKITSENDALDIALRMLTNCSTHATHPGQPAECPVILAYIKQHWGY